MKYIEIYFSSCTATGTQSNDLVGSERPVTNQFLTRNAQTPYNFIKFLPR